MVRFVMGNRNTIVNKHRNAAIGMVTDQSCYMHRAAAAAAGLSVQRYILDTLRPHLPPDDADQADT